MMRPCPLTILIAFSAIAAGQETQPEIIPAGYRLETVPTPPGVEFAVGGIAFHPNGDTWCCTRHGEVWKLHDGAWSLFAEGLHEALGLNIDPQTAQVFVLQRGELTELIDENHDGSCDFFRTVNADWGYSGNYHCYAFGLPRDSRGNFYGTLNLAHSNEGAVGGSIMGADAKYRGWSFQVTPDGIFTPWSSGLRSPCGIGINRHDELFYTDNQGDWNATNALYHVLKGRFHGHPSSLKDDPQFKGKDLNALTPEDYARLRTPPAVWLPYHLGQSAGEPVFNESGGKFGPFEDQVFIGDQTRNTLLRVSLEKVGGEYQGCVFPFVNRTQCGIIRAKFDRNGVLWLGQSGRGWGSAGGKQFGLQKILWDGKTIPFEIKAVSLLPDGFSITFTKPAASDSVRPDRLTMEHFHYRYSGQYGSPDLDRTPVTPASVTLSADGLIVTAKVPPVPDKIWTLRFADSVKSATGEPLANREASYTLNRLR
ncbi:MAG: hypothetical protein KA004_11545 [Verrucomicrobiales bacterium]|nr:hypothetical protein [Verrucomicrobiales bacterium]